MDLPFTELAEGRALAVFFQHLFFHGEKADEFTFHTSLIQSPNLSLDAEPNGKILPCIPHPHPHFLIWHSACLGPSTGTQPHPRSLSTGILFLTPACVSPLYIAVFA